MSVALDLLARREHGRQELSDKLQGKGFEAAEIQETLQRLEEDGYLSDLRYAETFCRSHAARGQGPRRLEEELRQRGVATPLIRQALAALEVDWLMLAREVREKRFGQLPAVDYAQQQKQLRFLLYRGFPLEIAREALA